MNSRWFISFKMTGFLTGLLSWGWRGMLIGFILGYLLDKHLSRYRKTSQQAPYGKRHRSRDEQLFFQFTFQMLGFLAKADGLVSQQEIHATEHIMSSMALTSDERLAAIEAFNSGKSQPEPPNHLIKQFKRRFKNRTGKKMEWLHYQFQLLYAEGKANTSLVETLGMTAFYAGIKPEQFQTIRQQYRKAWQDQFGKRGQGFSSGQQKQGRGGQSYQNRSEQTGSGDESAYQSYSRYRRYSNACQSFGHELNEAYQLLGVSPDSDLATLKRAFRQKISKVHPDKLAGQNASPQEHAKAKELSQQLQAAYQLIKKSRQAY